MQHPRLPRADTLHGHQRKDGLLRCHAVTCPLQRVAVGAVRLTESGELGQQGMPVFHKAGIRIRINAQCAQSQNDLRRTLRVFIPVGDVPAGIRQLTGKVLQRRVDLGLQPVPVGSQRLYRHGCDVHIRFSGDQTEAAVRLLSDHDGADHILSGILGICRNLRILRIQGNQRPDPAVQALRARITGIVVGSLRNQVNGRAVWLRSKVGGVAAQRHYRQGDPVVLRSLVLIQAAIFRVGVFYISSQRLQIVGVAFLRAGQCHGHSKPVADGSACGELLLILQKLSLLPAQGGHSLRALGDFRIQRRLGFRESHCGDQKQYAEQHRYQFRSVFHAAASKIRFISLWQ